MSILVTGARGFVGARIMEALPEAVAAPSLRDYTLDQIRRLVDEVQPDATIHTAAISDIGACERDPEASHRANVLLPLFLARAGGGILMAFFSTDQVYTGLPGDRPFREEQALGTNTYARHKLEMEGRILDAAPQAVMLRASWMYDMPLYGVKNRSNFLMLMLNAAARGGQMQFSAQAMRGITWVRQVAENTKKALSLPGGVYNFGSGADGSMYDLALLMKQKMQLQVDLRPGEGGENLWMDQEKLNAAGIQFSNNSDGLLACLACYSLI